MLVFGFVVLSLPLSVLLAPVRAAEVDNFTDRDSPPADGTKQINATINLQIHKAIDSIYEESVLEGVVGSKLFNPGCDKEKLLDALQEALDNNFPKPREMLWNSGNLPLEVRTDVYDKMEGAGVLMNVGACCDPVVNVKGHRIGLDKMDHSLSAGFVYYRKSLKGKTTEDLVKMGIEFEEGMWGLSGTGVKSYGDLAANYSGFLMYKDMLEGTDPNIQCVGGKFKLVRGVDYSKYVDDALDESINCSSYTTSKAAASFDAKIKSITGGKSCPLEPDKCRELAASAKYKAVAKYILHPNCLDPDRKGSAHETPMELPKAVVKSIGVY